MKTMVEHWHGEPNRMLKHVAQRAGSFMISSCVTERINKIPKEVWNDDRMRLTAASVICDVFLYANTDRLPQRASVFGWASVKGKGQ